MMSSRTRQTRVVAPHSGGDRGRPIKCCRPTMTVLDDVLAANDAYAASFGDKSQLALPPARGFAILTCMDARLDPAKYAGLSEGDAHVIRNAGGRASDDAIRSLVISYKLLGTAEWFVIHHTNCGMEFFTDEVIRDLLAKQPRDSGSRRGRFPRCRPRAGFVRGPVHRLADHRRQRPERDRGRRPHPFPSPSARSYSHLRLHLRRDHRAAGRGARSHQGRPAV